jgi:hypothetical protein
MTTGDEGNSHENRISSREEVFYDVSQMPYLVSACLSAEEAKDLACKLIDSGLPVMVDRLETLEDSTLIKAH